MKSWLFLLWFQAKVSVMIRGSNDKMNLKEIYDWNEESTGDPEFSLYKPSEEEDNTLKLLAELKTYSKNLKRRFPETLGSDSYFNKPEDSLSFNYDDLHQRRGTRKSALKQILPSRDLNETTINLDSDEQPNDISRKRKIIALENWESTMDPSMDPEVVKKRIIQHSNFEKGPVEPEAEHSTFKTPSSRIYNLETTNISGTQEESKKPVYQKIHNPANFMPTVSPTSMVEEQNVVTKIPNQSPLADDFKAFPELTSPPTSSATKETFLNSIRVGLRFANTNLLQYFNTMVSNNLKLILGIHEHNDGSNPLAFLPNLKILGLSVEKELMSEELQFATKLMNSWRADGGEDMVRGMTIVRMVLSRLFVRIRGEYFKFATNAELRDWDFIGGFVDAHANASVVTKEQALEYPKIWKACVEYILRTDSQSRSLLEAFRALLTVILDYRKFSQLPLVSVPLGTVYRRHLQMELFRLLGPSLVNRWREHALSVLTTHFHSQASLEMRLDHMPLTPAVARAILWMAPSLVPGNLDVGRREATSVMIRFEAHRKRKRVPLSQQNEASSNRLDPSTLFLKNPFAAKAIVAAHLRQQYLYPRLATDAVFTFAGLQEPSQKTDIRMLAELLLHLEVDLVTPIKFEFDQLASFVYGISFDSPDDQDVLMSYILDTGFLTKRPNAPCLPNPDDYHEAVMHLHLLLQEHVLVPVQQCTSVLSASMGKEEARQRAMEVLGIPVRIYKIAKQVRRMVVQLKRDWIDGISVSIESLREIIPRIAPPTWADNDIAEFMSLLLII